MLTVEEAGAALGVSRATVWRMLRRGDLQSIRRRGRRLIPAKAIRPGLGLRQRLRPLSPTHPLMAMIGIGDSGGKGPGARNKHAILGR